MTALEPNSADAEVERFSAEMTPREIDVLLDAEVHRIFRETENRLLLERNGRNDAERWAESAEDWMLVEVYLLVRALRDARKVKAIGRAITRASVRHKGRHTIANQPFKQALFLIFCIAAPGAESAFPRQRRSILGDALAYADVHDVPGEYLNGFVKQAGLTKCRAKLSGLYEEPRLSRRDVITIV